MTDNDIKIDSHKSSPLRITDLKNLKKDMLPETCSFQTAVFPIKKAGKPVSAHDLLQPIAPERLLECVVTIVGRNIRSTQILLVD